MLTGWYPIRVTRPTPAPKGRVHLSRNGVAGGVVMPVSGDDGAGVEVPAFLQVVGGEILEHHLVDRCAVGGTGNGPDIVHDESHGPMTGLHQSNDGWAEAQLSLAEHRASGCWEDHGGAEAADELTGMGGREEEGWVHVAEAQLAIGVLGGGGLPNEGLDNAGDEKPVFADAFGVTGWMLNMSCVRS
jgi:hypothetical protein